MALYDNWAWDGVNNIMTIAYDDVKGYSKETKFTLEDVQDCIDTKGWTGVDWAELGTPPTAFIQGIRFLVGASTYFGDLNKTIIFKDGIVGSTSRYFSMVVGCHLIFGTSPDAAKKHAKRGCTFIFEEINYAHKVFEASSFPRTGRYVECYGCTFISTVKQQTMGWLDSPGNHRFWKCLFDNMLLTGINGDWDGNVCTNGCTIKIGTSTYPFKRALISKCPKKLSAASVCEDIRVLDYAGASLTTSWVSPVTIDTMKVEGFPENVNIWYMSGTGSTLTLIDVESPTWKIEANPDIFYRKYRRAFQVLDAQGNPQQGYTVKLYDKDVIEVFSEVTDSEGKTPFAIVTSHIADHSTTWDYRGQFKRRVENGAFYQEDYIDIDNVCKDHIPIVITPPSKSLDDVFRFLANRWKIENDKFIIYEDDGVTPWKTFDLKNKRGEAAEVNVYERVPV